MEEEKMEQETKEKEKAAPAAKKPILWMVIAALAVIAAIGLGVSGNSKAAALTKERDALAAQLSEQETAHAEETKTLSQEKSTLNGDLTAAQETLTQTEADKADLEKQVKDLQASVDELTEKNKTLTEEKEQLNEDYEVLDEEKQELLAEIDELENGPAAILVEIRNAYEEKDWDTVIEKAEELHELANGTKKDKTGQKLAKEAQAALDKEEEDRKAKEAKGYETGITYDQLARNPDDYEFEKVKFKGKVLQVMEGDDTVTIRLAVNSDYDTVLLCMYQADIVDGRILEDDIITIYGTSMGIYTYEATSGASISIPSVIVTKIDT